MLHAGSGEERGRQLLRVSAEPGVQGRLGDTHKLRQTSGIRNACGILTNLGGYPLEVIFVPFFPATKPVRTAAQAGPQAMCESFLLSPEKNGGSCGAGGGQGKKGSNKYLYSKRRQGTDHRSQGHATRGGCSAIRHPGRHRLGVPALVPRSYFSFKLRTTLGWGSKVLTVLSALSLPFPRAFSS